MKPADFRLASYVGMLRQAFDSPDAPVSVTFTCDAGVEHQDAFVSLFCRVGKYVADERIIHIVPLVLPEFNLTFTDKIVEREVELWTMFTFDGNNIHITIRRDDDDNG